MKLGVTATRDGLTSTQKAWLELLIRKHRVTCLVHGDCIGGDADCHDIARKLGLRVEIRPPDNPKQRAFKNGDVVFSPKPYLERNHDIVDSVDAMLGFPAQVEEQWRGSGTWATIRYAKKQGKLRKIVFPNLPLE